MLQPFTDTHYPIRQHGIITKMTSDGADAQSTHTTPQSLSSAVKQHEA
ncbi:hypothetical protein HMPREF0971_02706 [Segatella oris F0302]|uniref:Uncharacterized protein n=1 Tax=Segatella oris F0302 TaxID=649760 RepID=D1QUM0_9BACT|nr:hypothetical protein HMPREF0971_02706 [Segatella oris F0302]